EDRSGSEGRGGSDERGETEDSADDNSAVPSFDGKNGMPANFGGASNRSSTLSNLAYYGVSFAVMILGLLFAKFYHRRNRRR
ncbi:MAG: hypothetical protein Q4B01_05790, partial [Eubacteriales bacterium]|nr:hypothetical protein [Eubacteriales bacterium]